MATKRSADISCLKCCFCCLDDGDLVKLAMKNFDPMPVRYAQSGQIQILTGACQPAGVAFYTPATNSPCVFYKIEIEEEIKTGEETRWKTIFRDEKFADFYICDGPSAIWVQGSNPGFCKRFSETITARGGGWSHFNSQNLPQGVQNLVNASRGRFMGGWNGWSNNRYRYSESSFDVGETLAVLSLIGDGMDPYTGQPVKVAQLFLPDANFFNNSKAEWEEWDIRAVKDLAGTQGVVLVSDSKRLIEGW